jgi:thiamine biosynthesis lipoprotein
MRAAALAAVLALGGCERGPPLHEATIPAAGGEVTVQAHARDAAKWKDAIAEVTARAAADTAQWHAWKPSALGDINDAFRRGAPADTTPGIQQLMATSRAYANATGGLLDPAIGDLVELWGFHADVFPLSTPPPDKASVDAWLAARPRLSQVSSTGTRLATDNPRLRLDFNAIIEGVTANEVAAILRRHAIADARVAMGGDTYVLGSDAGDPWRVGLRDPYGGELGHVELADGEAFFTSGNYDKFRTSTSGGRWGHVLDPRTGMPARGAAAVAVLTDDPVLADAASTALMVGGPSAFASLLERLHVGCALMVTEENELLITSAMRRRMTFARDPIPLGRDLNAGKDCRAPRPAA